MFDIVLDINITFVKFGSVIGVLVVLGLLIFSNNSSGPSYVTVRGEVSTIGNGNVYFIKSEGKTALRALMDWLDNMIKILISINIMILNI